MAFEFEKKIRFGEIDQAGIVYYPRFFNYYHLAMEDFFEKAVGVPYPEVIKTWKVGFPTVAVEADFSEPLQYGDVISILMTIPKVGRSSVRWRYRVRRQDGKVCSEATLTTVCVDMDTFRSRQIPEDIRRVLLRHGDDSEPEERMHV